MAFSYQYVSIFFIWEFSGTDSKCHYVMALYMKINLRRVIEEWDGYRYEYSHISGYLSVKKHNLVN